MQATASPRVVVYSAIALAIISIAHIVEIPRTSLLWSELSNAGHVVLMGTFALVVVRVLPDVLGERYSSRLHHYIVAFWVTVAIGALAEAAQIPGPRDADIADVVRNAAGALAFLSLYSMKDRSLSSFWKRRGRPARVTLVTAATLSLIAVWAPTVFWVAAFHHRNTIFPRLITFDSNFERRFWTTRNASLERALPPTAWGTEQSSMVGRLVSLPTTRSGFALNETFPDWSSHSFLQIRVYLDDTSPTDFTVQIRDSRSRDRADSLFTYSSRIRPAANVVLVPLEFASDTERGRLLDLEHITTVYFYTSDTTRILTLYLDDITLR